MANGYAIASDNGVPFRHVAGLDDNWFASYADAAAAATAKYANPEQKDRPMRVAIVEVTTRIVGHVYDVH